MAIMMNKTQNLSEFELSSVLSLTVLKTENNDANENPVDFLVSISVANCT